jgi:hypothetical protein
VVDYSILSSRLSVPLVDDCLSGLSLVEPYRIASTAECGRKRPKEIPGPSPPSLEDFLSGTTHYVTDTTRDGRERQEPPACLSKRGNYAGRRVNLPLRARLVAPIT